MSQNLNSAGKIAKIFINHPLTGILGIFILILGSLHFFFIFFSMPLQKALFLPKVYPKTHIFPALLLDLKEYNELLPW